MTGHPGRYKTHELITRNYWWPGIHRDIRKYVEGCGECQRVKPIRQSPHNPLHPHDVPSEPWQVISVDLIGELPESQGYNAICVVVDRFTKQIHVLPTNTTIILEGMAKLYQDHIFKLYSIPQKIIHDRGPQFDLHFMKDLNELLNIERNPSTAYHPQTDGQTERIDQEIEQYLQIFINYHQNDWAEWLPMAEFAYNNKVQSSTGHSPFMAIYGYHPNMGTNLRRDARNESAIQFTTRMKAVREEVEASLKRGQPNHEGQL